MDNDGTIEQVNDELRERTRISVGRESSPSVALIDSQSVKMTRVGGSERGYDGGKNVKDRKRHIITDTDGLLLSAVSPQQIHMIVNRAMETARFADLLLACLFAGT